MVIFWISLKIQRKTLFMKLFLCSYMSIEFILVYVESTFINLDEFDLTNVETVIKTLETRFKCDVVKKAFRMQRCIIASVCAQCKCPSLDGMCVVSYTKASNYKTYKEIANCIRVLYFSRKQKTKIHKNSWLCSVTRCDSAMLKQVAFKLAVQSIDERLTLYIPFMPSTLEQILNGCIKNLFVCNDVFYFIALWALCKSLHCFRESVHSIAVNKIPILTWLRVYVIKSKNMKFT